MLVSKSVKKGSGINSAASKTQHPDTKSKAGKRQSSKTNRPVIAIQYVLPLGNGWVVKSSKAAKFTLISISKREAVSIARSIAKSRGEILEVHDRDGKISEKKRYA